MLVILYILCNIALILLTMCLTLVNANISWNTFTTIVISGKIRIDPMDVIFYSPGLFIGNELGT